MTGPEILFILALDRWQFLYDVGNGWAINWKATGGIWMGVGGVLTLIGLTRRH